jgi:hypothetical protein
MGVPPGPREYTHPSFAGMGHRPGISLAQASLSLPTRREQAAVELLMLFKPRKRDKRFFGGTYGDL